MVVVILDFELCLKGVVKTLLLVMAVSSLECLAWRKLWSEWDDETPEFEAMESELTERLAELEANYTEQIHFECKFWISGDSIVLVKVFCTLLSRLVCEETRRFWNGSEAGLVFSSF